MDSGAYLKIQTHSQLSHPVQLSAVVNIKIMHNTSAKCLIIIHVMRLQKL